MITSKRIKNKVTELGADVCGIATVKKFEKAPQGFHPYDIFPDCKSVIVFAAHFPLSTLNINTNSPYTFTRNMMVQKLDLIAFHLAEYLEKERIISIPIPSAEPYDYWDSDRRHGRGILSLKHAGYLAGLGEIGKNTLLINQKYGNMIWLGAVLVSVELESDQINDNNLCPDNCRICIDTCPQKALDGNTINQKRCRERSISFTDGGSWVLSCNLCRKVCPKFNGKD